MTVTANDLPQILASHAEWLVNNTKGVRANLRRANLYGANLYGANLYGADLRGADLRRANLHSADLRGADLRSADLRSANLHSANLLSADLRGANLLSADLYGADLRSADLRGADLSAFQIPQEGALIVWKAVDGGIAKIEVPAEAKRTACLINRKCRAEYVRTLEIIIKGKQVTDAIGRYDSGTKYIVGEITRPDSYNDDPREDCTNGIHFFLTREEAEKW